MYSQSSTFLYIYKYPCFEISTIDQLTLSLKSKIYSQKDILPSYIEFAKNHKRFGRFSWSQKPYNGKIYFEPCFQLLKKNESGQIEKTQQVYLGEKRERISAIRNTVFHDAENLGLLPVLEPYSEKDWTMEQEIANGHVLYDVATYKKRRVCVSQSRSTVWTSNPTFIFDSSLQRRTKSWSKLPMSTILWRNSKNTPTSWEILCLLRTVRFKNFVDWWYYIHLIQIFIFLNHFSSWKIFLRWAVWVGTFVFPEILFKSIKTNRDFFISS